MIWVRCSLWQVKHTSGCVTLSRTLSWAVWTWWHEAQATSRTWWVLPSQWERLASVRWQVRHCSFSAAAGERLLPRKRTSGFGRSLPLPALVMWASLSPWQLVHVGVRLSATVPWAVLPMASTGKSSPSSWHRVHFASPRSTMSLWVVAPGASSAASDGNAAPSRSNPAAASVWRNQRCLLIFVPFPSENRIGEIGWALVAP